MTDEDANALIYDLRRRTVAVERNRARAEAARDAARDAATAALAQLQRDYGVSDVESARAKLAELTDTFTARVATFRDLLDDIGEQT